MIATVALASITHATAITTNDCSLNNVYGSLRLLPAPDMVPIMAQSHRRDGRNPQIQGVYNEQADPSDGHPVTN